MTKNVESVYNNTPYWCVYISFDLIIAVSPFELKKKSTLNIVYIYWFT